MFHVVHTSCPPRTFLPALCRIFLDELVPDSVLEVTARAITYYLDVSAECTRRVVAMEGAVKAICSRLSGAGLGSRASRDLAEQCIKVDDRELTIKRSTRDSAVLISSSSDSGVGACVREGSGRSVRSWWPSLCLVLHPRARSARTSGHTALGDGSGHPAMRQSRTPRQSSAGLCRSVVGLTETRRRACRGRGASLLRVVG